jgi:predicted Zn-ribbon and HTH transcriptional regulator
MKEIISHGQICKKCGYTWFSRIEKPKRCPYCERWLNKKEVCFLKGGE